MNMLDYSLEYHSQGLSVIPVATKAKKPLLKSWEPFQKRLPTEEEIRKWWTQWPEAGIALVTGSISGVVAVDIEEGGDIADLPDSVKAKSGGGGYHFFYKYDAKRPVSNGARVKDLTDIRGDGGYIILAPSLHPSGNRYEWITQFDREALAPFPYDLFPASPKPKPTKKSQTNENEEDLLERVNREGSRNDAAAKVAGKLIANIGEDLRENVGWPRFEKWNQEKNNPPLEEKELRSVWDSIERSEMSSEGGGKQAQADILMNLVRDKECEFFRCDRNEPFMRVPVGDHWEQFPCRSEDCKLWLGKIYWDEVGSPISPDNIKKVRDTIASIARFEGESIQLYNRTAWSQDALWYDLGDNHWQTIKVTENGWEIIPKPPILFRRYTHQSPQVLPTPNGNVKTLLEFVNITDPDQQLLFLVWIVSCFIPDFPHAILSIHGQQGSAKSVISRICRQVIDPSRLQTLNFPANKKEFVQVLDHHWVLPFDNLSLLPAWGADAVCRAVTGEGDSKRMLFTDDQDIIVCFRRCIILNGINLPSEKSDLLERTLLFELEKIPKAKRREENQVMTGFHNALPSILGGIFNTLVEAIKLKPSITVPELPRMADWTLWGCAIAEGLGYGQEAFLSAYFSNIDRVNKKVLTENIIAELLVEFMDGRTEWTGTPTDLYSAVESIAEEKKIHKKELPKTPNWLTRKINMVKPNLEEAGITIFESKSGNRHITIRKDDWDSVLSPEEAIEPDQAEDNPVDATSDAKNAPTVDPVDQQPGFIPEPPKDSGRKDAKDDKDITVGDMPPEEAVALFKDWNL